MEYNLDIRTSSRIGSYDQSQVYSTEVIGDYIYFGITDYTEMNEVRVVDSNGNEVATYDVGILPGDFTIWQK